VFLVTGNNLIMPEEDNRKLLGVPAHKTQKLLSELLLEEDTPPTTAVLPSSRRFSAAETAVLSDLLHDMLCEISDESRMDESSADSTTYSCVAGKLVLL
jgi:hypothetical protein